MGVLIIDENGNEQYRTTSKITSKTKGPFAPEHEIAPRLEIVVPEPGQENKNPWHPGLDYVPGTPQLH